MSSKTTQKQKGRKGRGPLLAMLVLFADADVAADLFRSIRWANGLICPDCKEGDSVTKYCKYKDNIQRLTRTPNFETDFCTSLHRH